MENNSYNVKSVVADPTALGLTGLAMVTLVASTQKLGITDGTSLIVPWAIFLGAIAQILASIFDFKHNNLFGAIAFAAYGFFWLAVGTTWMIGHGVFGESMKAAMDFTQLGFAFVGYLILSLILTVVALRLNKFLTLTMILIDILLLSLAMDTFGMGGAWHTIAAYSELLISLFSFYGVAGALINKTYERVIVPMGKPWAK